MNTIPRNALVVAIGVDGNDSALEYAVAEARRTGRPIHLVHVLQLPATEAYARVYSGVIDAARATLDDALDRAGRIAGTGVSITGELIDNGWVIDDLVQAGVADTVLVLQHRAFGRLHRVFTGSVVQGVASRARVPVVSVPEGWAPRPTSGVTAAVQNTVEAAPLLRVAFEAARSRATSLVVLHAWWLASGFDVTVVDDAVRAEWMNRSRAELEPALAPLRDEFPDVKVRVEVRHAPPVEAVLDAAETSSLLVLGRRHHLLPLGSHLGSVARAAIAHAAAPVLIAPELGVTAAAAADSERPVERVGSPG